MSVKILEVKREACPPARLIGKSYEGAANWGEWWENGWFEILEAVPCLPFNGNAYLGGVHIKEGMPKRWIGMLFPAGTEVPEEFDFADIEAMDYAVCYLYGKEGSADFFSMETHEKCLEELRAQGFLRKEDDWCFERCNCPRYTTPDENGNVILDYAISVEKCMD